MSQTYCLKVTGDWACFSRPDLKTERFSYPVITPSAARAIYEAVFWKPPVRWVITRIEVLKPIQYETVRRNEVDRIAGNPTRQAMAGGTTTAMALYVEDNRQQRAANILRDVAYRLYADMQIDARQLKPDETVTKYRQMFERRAGKGQCFNQPYLGCREFSACFELVSATPRPEDTPEPPIQHTEALGWMLYDLDFSNPANIQPMFYNPVMTNGSILVPAPDSPEVKR
jgi:CRISPR-associated protein Cas5d